MSSVRTVNRRPLVLLAALGLAAAACGETGGALSTAGQTGQLLVGQVIGTGRVHHFDMATGTVLRSYPDPTSDAANLFGSSVEPACSASPCGAESRSACVGSPGADGGSGRVDCFSQSTGAHTLTIPNPEPAPGALFGVAMKSVGTKLYVGAPGASNRDGRVYEFDMMFPQNWLFYQRPFADQNALFGSSINYAFGNLWVGSPGAGDGAGRLDAFDPVTRTHRTQVIPVETFTKAFGFSQTQVGIGNLAVGAPLSAGSGQAFLVNGSTGRFLATMTDPTALAGDASGKSVACFVNVFVGAPFSLREIGEVNVFSSTDGTYLGTITNPTPAQEDRFGSSVTRIDDKIVVSAPGDDTGGPDAGAAYVFDPLTRRLLHTLVNPPPS